MKVKYRVQVSMKLLGAVGIGKAYPLLQALFHEPYVNLKEKTAKSLRKVSIVVQTCRRCKEPSSHPFIHLPSRAIFNLCVGEGERIGMVTNDTQSTLTNQVHMMTQQIDVSQTLFLAAPVLCNGLTK